MFNPHPIYATLLIVTHPPAPEPGQHQIIIGFGLLIVSKLTDKAFGYTARTGIADTLDDETQLLTELADALPHPTFVFGDRINESVIEPLERAADRQPPIVAAFLRQRLARYQSAILVDTAHSVRPHSPPMCGDTDREIPDVVIDVAGNAIVDVEAAYDDLEQCVIDKWWRFVSP